MAEKNDEEVREFQRRWKIYLRSSQKIMEWKSMGI